MVNRAHGGVEEQPEKMSSEDPTKQEQLRMAFSRRLLHFQAVFHLPSCSTVTGWLFRLQASEDKGSTFGSGRQRSSCGNPVHAAVVKLKPPCLFLRSHQHFSISLTLSRGYGCSVRHCCCLEPHESWTQEGLSILCWVRSRDPLSIAEKR